MKTIQMNTEPDIYSDESLRDDIQELAAIERGVLEASCPLPDMDEELRRVFEADAEKVAPRAPRRHQTLRLLVSAALGAAAMLAVVFLWNRFFPTAADSSALTAGAQDVATIQTGLRERLTLTLADGTEVSLNANSRLDYPHEFTGKERRVCLRGEAFFRVKHSDSQPFVVDAGNTTITDLGTAFNVNAPTADQCRVTLVEGSVAVRSKSSAAAPAVLVPGQQVAVVGASKPRVKEVNAQETSAWVDNIYYYHDQPLRHVVGDLAAKYHKTLDMRNEKVAPVHIDFSTDRSNSLEETLTLLNGLGIADVRVEGDRIVVE